MEAAHLFSPWDFRVASINFEAMCGHGALAAAIRCDVCHVMQFFDRGGWVNVPTMEEALIRAGKSPISVRGWDEKHRPAVTILQFLGPWMSPGVPPAARCRYRHWVATFGRLVWDINTGKWLPREQWEADVIDDLMPPRGTGYEAFRTLVWEQPATTASPAPKSIPLPETGKLQEGRYESTAGGYFDILDVQLPGYPKYDGGAPGVTVRFAGAEAFHVVENEAKFWSRFPFHLFNRVPVQRSARSADASQPESRRIPDEIIKTIPKPWLGDEWRRELMRRDFPLGPVHWRCGTAHGSTCDVNFRAGEPLAVQALRMEVWPIGPAHQSETGQFR